MSVISIVLTPIDYFFIKHNEKKWFDFVLPAAASFLAVLIILSLPKTISFLGKDSLISLVNGILQILSGFYIASMAAVATFQKNGMDDVMNGVPPKLRGKNLTRRKFLTYLFGYLAFSSISLYFLGGALQLSSDSIKEISFFSTTYSKAFFMFVYMFFVGNILSTTALGMYFMINKMHDNNPTLNIPPENEGD